MITLHFFTKIPLSTKMSLRTLKQIGGVIGLIGMITYGFIQFEDHISQVKDGWFVISLVVIGLLMLLLLISRILRD